MLQFIISEQFDWKQCRTEKFIQQKLNYIHYNPCKGNKLVESCRNNMNIALQGFI